MRAFTAWLCAYLVFFTWTPAFAWTVEGSGATLPDQSGHAGKYLTTDGTDASWAAVAGGGDLLANGTIPLTANWDAGSFKITAEQFESDVATGTAPFIVASTTEVTNLRSATASALAANGANCGAGSLAAGVDAAGAAEGCVDVWTEAENTAAAYGDVSGPGSSTDWELVFFNGATGKIIRGGSGIIGDANGKLIFPTGATAGYCFGDGNTCTYENSDNVVYLTNNGNITWVRNSSGALYGNNTNAPMIWPSIPTSTDPPYTFLSDEDTGFTRNGANQPGIVAGGVSIFHGESQGVKVTMGTDGQITFLGIGDGVGDNDEDLTLDFETTANKVGVSSSTGVTDIDLGTIGVQTTGDITGSVMVNEKAATYTLGSDDARESYGGYILFTAVATLNLPDAVEGMSFCADMEAAAILTIEPNGSEIIWLEGTNATAGVNVAASGAAGDYICMIAISATEWRTLGTGGTWAVGS
jgi:hypothetical protein